MLAGELMQMGSWNTPLVGEACTTRDPPSRDLGEGGLGVPLV